MVIRPSGKWLTLRMESTEIGRSTSTPSTNCGNRGGRSANVVLRTIVLVPDMRAADERLGIELSVFSYRRCHSSIKDEKELLAHSLEVRNMTRRLWFRFLLPIFTVLPSWSQPRLGDEEWMRRFRSFVKLFNTFVESLNEEKFDFPTWQRMRDAWRKLEAE